MDPTRFVLGAWAAPDPALRSAQHFKISWFLPVLLVAILGGCSSGLDGVEKRLGSMRDEITALQNQNDRLVERVDALELRRVQAATPPAPAAAAKAATTERPPLKIVRLVPGEGEQGAAPTGDASAGESADDPGPRTVIRGRGSNVEGRLATGELMPGGPSEGEGRRRKSSASETETSQTKDSESPKRDSKGN
jgi:hypothetical protein